ncbi:MAG: hypothetical protein HC857_17845 [Synechococcales cyanobacterium RU_4_20]|nr:hypothetical protein [Synechococcales cyanobacterium RU_4_20]NJR71620.1 hypothetical protein [Synechococcales cyanobacterium CRU_2_2]
MNDFGKGAIALGRLTDDGGFIGVAGGAAFLFGFAFNPLLGAAIALTTANDIANAAREKREARLLQREGERELYELPDLPEGEDAIAPRLNPAAGEKFRKVQLENGSKSSAKSSAQTPDPDDWIDEAWMPPPPDLSLLPIKEFKEEVEAGVYRASDLHLVATRSGATGKVFEYLKKFSSSENIEYLVWFVFGLNKGGNAWYALASDFCRQCRDHYQRKGAPPPDDRMTW